MFYTSATTLHNFDVGNSTVNLYEHNSTTYYDDQNSTINYDVENTTIYDVEHITNYDELFEPYYWTYFCLPMIAFGVVGNLISIVVFISSSKLWKTSYSIYVIGLTISDTLFLISM